MTLAIIISPYNAPTSAARAQNVRLGIALARWAAAQGYTPVGWWDMIDINDPPDDADPNVRLPALKRDCERARMVGAAGGVAVVPAFVKETAGMHADVSAWLDGRGPWDGNRRLLLVFSEDIPPYLLPEPEPMAEWVKRAYARAAECLNDAPEPVPTVSRAAVQAAVDRIAFEARADQNTARHDRDQSRYYYARFDGRQNDLALIEKYTGVTPSEVQ